MIEAYRNVAIPTNGPLTKLLGGPPREKLDVARKASPINHVTKDDPPFLLVHGDKDRTVNIRQSEMLNDRLKEAGVDVTFLVVKNGAHGNFGPEAEPDTAAINQAVASFFEKHLKAKKPSAEGAGPRCP